jgi:lysophospholipase L1-like esterase
MEAYDAAMQKRLIAFLGTMALAVACSDGTSATTDGGPDATDASTGPHYATYVILGDSISAGGGEGPFFYDLLVANDDATYPAWHGKDLQTRYGIGAANVVKASKGGAVSSNLAGQLATVSHDLPGPVLVTITIGGNNMTASFVDILQGQDAKDITAMKADLDAALAEIHSPDRFGKGVTATVFEANVYDPSDDVAANFSNCPTPLNLIPSTFDIATTFTTWNQMVSTAVAANAGDVDVDIHGKFLGHGVQLPSDGTRWFFTDCIHPNRYGHDELRQAFWSAITGEK